ncbi:MAG: hypothetical protein GX303_04625 [Clostridiales bacterium]|nr:hypothetical protein [Clostridiales bacterium]
MAVYNIAGLYVEMTPQGSLLKKQALPYLADRKGAVDFTINIPANAIEEQVKRYPHLTFAECEYLAYGAVFYHKLIDNMGFMLHSSAVVYDGYAYMFSGSCGAGKSTHTSLWVKHFGADKAFIINDDKPAIRYIDERFYVFGTPFSGKTDTSRNTSAPPAALCFIEQGPENEIIKLSTEEAIPRLLEQTTRSASGKRGDILFDLLDKFLRSIDVYLLTCTISTQAVEIAYNAMSKRIKGE